MHAARCRHPRRRAATLAVMTAAGIEQRDDANAIARGLERFRAVRRSLEEAVLPLATSLDGRRFTFQASLHGLELQLGGYVVIEHGDRREASARCSTSRSSTRAGPSWTSRPTIPDRSASRPASRSGSRAARAR